jgi:hypothetical protein
MCQIYMGTMVLSSSLGLWEWLHIFVGWVYKPTHVLKCEPW